MADNIYMKQKITPQVDDTSDRQLKFLRDREALKNTAPEINSNLGQQISKDLPVEHIDKLQAKDMSRPSDVYAKIAEHRANRAAQKGAIGISDVAEKVLPAGNWKQEFVQKSMQAARNPAAKKAMGIIPFVAPAMALMNGEPAQAAEEVVADVAPVYDAIRPTESGPAQGSFDQRLESGQLTPEEQQQMLQQQARIKALQGLR